MTEHFNKLTPAQAERLALLAEECGEVVQAVGKILRHGYESTHPDGGLSNRETLEKECGHVLHALTRLSEADDINRPSVELFERAKASSVSRYLHHA